MYNKKLVCAVTIISLVFSACGAQQTQEEAIEEAIQQDIKTLERQAAEQSLRAAIEEDISQLEKQTQEESRPPISDPALTAPALADPALPDASNPSQSGFTQPGTRLAVGDQAVFPEEESGAPIGIRVTEISSPTPALQAEVAPKLQGLELSLVRIEVQNLSDADLSFKRLHRMALQTADGARGSSMILSGFDECPNSSASENFTNGATHTTCLGYAFEPGTAIEAVWEGNRDAGYGDNKVTWS